jgi:hypothetical protein
VTARRWWVLVLIAVAAGCSDSNGSCEFCGTSAIVYGSVQRPNGTSVAGAPVVVGAYRGACGVGDVEVPSDLLTTDADGRYRIQLVAITREFTACVRVTAREPGSTNEVPGVAVDGVVDFRTEPVDSVQVDVELP